MTNVNLFIQSIFTLVNRFCQGLKLRQVDMIHDGISITEQNDKEAKNVP